MGSTANSVGVTFYVHDDQDAFPDDRKALEDFQALLGAVLADPCYEDLVFDGGGYVDAYRTMLADPVARGRVAFILIQALARVRRGAAVEALTEGQVCVCAHPLSQHNVNGLCIAVPGVTGCGCLGFLVRKGE